MGTVDRGPIMAARSQCPVTLRRFLSIRRLTGDAITFFTLASFPGLPAAAYALSRRRRGAEILLTRHHGPADARHLVGERHRHELALFGGEQFGQPGVLFGALGA